MSQVIRIYLCSTEYINNFKLKTCKDSLITYIERFEKKEIVWRSEVFLEPIHYWDVIMKLHLVVNGLMDTWLDLYESTVNTPKISAVSHQPGMSLFRRSVRSCLKKQWYSKIATLRTKNPLISNWATWPTTQRLSWLRPTYVYVG